MAESRKVSCQGLCTEQSAMQDMAEVIGTAARYYEQGDFSRAVEVCESGLAQGGEDRQLLHLLGKAAFQLGHFGQAEKYLRRAFMRNRTDPALYNTLGVILEAQGRFAEAAGAYSRAVELKPGFAEAWLNMAVARAADRDWQGGAEACLRALALRPNWARAHDALGFVQQSMGAFEQAEASFRRAVELDGDLVDARNHLGAALNRRGHFPAAAVHLRSAVERAAEHADAWNNLGISEKGLARFEEAHSCFRRAVELEPGFAQAHYNLGNALREIGDCEGAIASHYRAIELMPDFAWAHWNLSHALLASGRFEEGWREYLWRHDKRLGIVTYPHQLDLPQWDGRQFENKRLLVHYEQGLGDNIQFVRYLPMVKERGGTVVLEVPWQLHSLFKYCDGIDELIPAAGPDAPPPVGRFDWAVSPLDLPHIFGTRLETIPAQVPYVYADVDKSRAWWPRLRGQQFKIGIVWAGSQAHGRDAQRSCSLEHFMPLAGMDGVRAYSLQKGPAAAQLARFDPHRRIVDLADELKDFSDVAAVIINLDLVITVDTAAAHLAGAMARPVWTVLPFVADWRWMSGRSDTPWYPTMQLFRQEQRGDWAGVFRRVESELHKLLAQYAARG